MLELFFDDCISPKMIREIKGLIQYHPQKEVLIHHLKDHFNAQGEKDIFWLNKIDKNWLVITTDRGVYSKQEDKLPLICKQLGIKLILISAGIHKRKQFYKALAILYCWDDILKLADEQPGVQYCLRLTTYLKPYLIQKKTQKPVTKYPIKQIKSL